MNNYNKDVKRLFHIAAVSFLMFTTLLTASCNREDDVEAIFTNNDWKLSFYTNNGHRISSNNKIYALDFTEQTFTLTTPSLSTITGSWTANAKEHSFSCSNVKVSGSISGDTIAQRLKTMLINAISYEGNDTYLQLHDNNYNYMQYYSK